MLELRIDNFEMPIRLSIAVFMLLAGVSRAAPPAREDSLYPRPDGTPTLRRAMRTHELPLTARNELLDLLTAPSRNFVSR